MPELPFFQKVTKLASSTICKFSWLKESDEGVAGGGGDEGEQQREGRGVKLLKLVELVELELTHWQERKKLGDSRVGERETGENLTQYVPEVEN